ncbi:hypothetical protein Cgig2_011029 [Carnegiea gigantea]|uniref:Uncharacterized protein n=1 Tax=Carnegiea gigantea TaxID=171969 RepID=A0A9Q1KFV6_9CARY|nr:hypothetical protein Cgig2_011029 [Carnegiea gigantea]
MVDKRPRSSPQRVVSHQIETVLTEIPLPYCRFPSRKNTTLRSKRQVRSRLEVSFDMLRVINLPDLCESILPEILHDDEPDCNPQATLLALFEWQDTKSRWFLSNPVGYASNPTDSPDHNRNVPPAAHIAQPGEPPVLDGVRPHHHSQSTTARPRPYAAALKFGLGGHGHSQVSPSEPKLNSQLPGSDPSGLLSVGTHPRRTSSLKPQGPSAVTKSPLIETALTEVNTSKQATTHAEHRRIILARHIVMPNQGEDSSNSDPLLAMDNDEVEGMDAEENDDMYLNLEHLLDVKPPGYMVALRFYDAIISSRQKGILAACISYDVFNVILMDYAGSYGLDLVSSINPLALFEELKLNKFLLVPTTERVKTIMGGYWILPKCISTRGAPNSSEQLTFGHIWLSPPPNTRSMMHIIKSDSTNY